MPISERTIEHLARLANLDLDPDERDRLAKDLGAILEYVERLADTEEGTALEIPSMTQLREDTPTPPLPSGIAVSVAPERHNELFKVPPVLGSERPKPA
jgi:aspartyl-tRNA(Asn)/glutamyl-tRNA(Gln) amidotransferase subunit C